MNDNIKVAIVSGLFLVVSAIITGGFSLKAAVKDSNHKKDPETIQHQGAECYFPDSPKDKAPLWICFGELKEGMIFTVGAASASKAGSAFMKNIAVADARAHLIERIKIEIRKHVGLSGSDTKKILQTVTVNSSANGMILGSRVYKSRVSPQGSLYVLVGAEFHPKNYLSPAHNK